MTTAKRGSALHGRDSELRLIKTMLRRGRDRSGSVILVEGEPGMGKTLLLAEAAKAATAEGYITVTAIADEFAQTIPLWPLLQALGAVADDGADDSDPDPRMRAVGRVRRRLDSLMARGPVLVTADDLHHADPITLLALRVLSRHYAASSSLAWILARSTDDAAGAQRLFDLLHQDGALRIRLGPLSDTAISELITDLLGVPPGEVLLKLARSTGGNPFLVRELLDGLQEEEMLLASTERAVVAAERVPERVRRFIERRMAMVLPQTQQLIEVSAIVGRTFAADDAAEMLGQPPAAVLPAINEALAAGIFAVRNRRLSFRDGMTWRAVNEGIPDSVALALHRQFGRILLDRGNLLQAAGHLLKGARNGDNRKLEELDGVIGKLLPRSPQTAADLAMRVLELTAVGEPARPDRSVTAVRALTAAWRLREATKLIEASLSASLPASQRVQLLNARLAILTLSSRPDQVRAEAEALLAEPGLPERVRDEATVALFRALGELPDQALAEARANTVIGQPDHASGIATAAAKTLLAGVRWNQGQIGACLELLRDATTPPPGMAGQGHVPFHLLCDRAARLVDVRLFDEASALLSVRREDDDPASLALAQAYPAVLRARMHLVSGRIDSAVAELEAVLGVDPGADASPYFVLSQCMLGVIALRLGDLGAAGQWLDRVSAHLPEAGSGRMGILCRLQAARITEVRDGAAEAMAVAHDIYDYVERFRWPLSYDPEVPPWLVRLALAVGDDELATSICRAIDEVGAANPEYPVVVAACAHAHGLLHRDPDLLQQAAQTQPDLWASASAAEDLAVLLASASRASDALDWMESAYDNFRAAGAGYDIARVRGRLRGLGVRRQPEPALKRPLTGVNSLTESERNIAVLVTHGLTNREIAERSFVSANTVAFHLRNIYRKLGITSRVQLTRTLLGAG